jgi:hypothetical protein
MTTEVLDRDAIEILADLTRKRSWTPTATQFPSWTAAVPRVVRRSPSCTPHSTDVHEVVRQTRHRCQCLLSPGTERELSLPDCPLTSRLCNDSDNLYLILELLPGQVGLVAVLVRRHLPNDNPSSREGIGESSQRF